MAVPERAAALLDFWFGPVGDPDREKHRDIWFRSPPEHDEALRQRFLADYQRAAAGEFAAWEAAPESALALVLLLDQIPRNIFRDTPRAYATDALARAAAERALGRGDDAALPPVWRKFLYMPFHHSEDLADQRRAMALWDGLPDERDRRELRDPERGANRRYGMPYPEVIARFGRFPHRNAILGRPSTAEEIAFLGEAEAKRRAG